MSNVEQLKVWEKSIELATLIYSYTRYWKDFWLANQMQRASVSIWSNLAEWCDRETYKEYIRFIYIARWSCSELKTQLYIAHNIWYLDKEKLEDIMILIQDIHKMLNGLISHLRKQINDNNKNHISNN
jgi:four helix bundle protein